MKVTSITVERNFHILNDDRFIMEKISVTAEIEDTDFVQVAIDNARDVIISNFKKAYPKVEEHLNFHVVRQVNNVFSIDGIKESKMNINAEQPFATFGNGNFISKSEKIEKQDPFIEIPKCNTLTQLKEWELLASLNHKLKIIYDEQLDLLTNKHEPTY